MELIFSRFDHWSTVKAEESRGTVAELVWFGKAERAQRAQLCARQHREIIKALDMQPSEFFKALDTSANELRNRTRVRNLAPAQAIDRGDTKGDTLGAHCQPPLENSNVVEFCCGALTR